MIRTLTYFDLFGLYLNLLSSKKEKWRKIFTLLYVIMKFYILNYA